MRLAYTALGLSLLSVSAFAQAWSGHAHDPQHTAVSAYRSQNLNSIHWSTPVDLNPPSSGGELLIHYGSPLITAANTVILPTKTGLTGGYEIQGIHNGTVLYTLSSDYTQPAHDWIPPYGPVLGQRSVVYYPGAGGTILYRTSYDSATGTTGRFAFYGLSAYNANQSTFNSTVTINTPLTVDRYGTIYFGFIVTGSNPAGLTSGIGRVTIAGAGSWVPISSLGIADGSIVQVATNAAPALSNDQKTLYVAVSDGNVFGHGYLASVNSTSLAPVSSALLVDPNTTNNAVVTTDSSATPMVGPDGDVYFGVLESPCCGSHNDRGWLLHFDSTLSQVKTPGSFGWDNTPALVTSTLVPSYTGTSPYLLLTKYNNYAELGTGTGINQVAVLDPGASQTDLYGTSVQVMKEILTINGQTPDNQPGHPYAVREWCINTAAVDPATKSALVNSEDGWLYRWDFTTNSFTQKIQLTSGIGEAYTPTAIGQDGTVFAINDAVLFAVGN